MTPTEERLRALGEKVHEVLTEKSERVARELAERRLVLSRFLHTMDVLVARTRAARNPETRAELYGFACAFWEALLSLGVRGIAEQARFRADLHRAVATLPTGKPHEDGKVAYVLRDGYRFVPEGGTAYLLRPQEVVTYRYRKETDGLRRD